MILTDIGEIGVNAGEEHFVLRPSLYAMSRLGTPSEIVNIFASVMCETPHKYQLADALTVIYACAGDHDASRAFGHVVDVQAKPRLLDAKQELKAAEYQPGLATIEQTIIIAQTLLRHGVVGDLEPLKSRKNKEPEYVKEFDCREHASVAMAHLGVSSKEAWQMTMTEIVGALRAKYPEPESTGPGAKAPTIEEHDKTMEWFDKIEAKRAAAKKG